MIYINLEKLVFIKLQIYYMKYDAAYFFQLLNDSKELIEPNIVKSLEQIRNGFKLK